MLVGRIKGAEGIDPKDYDEFMEKLANVSFLTTDTESLATTKIGFTRKNGKNYVMVDAVDDRDLDDEKDRLALTVEVRKLKQSEIEALAQEQEALEEQLVAAQIRAAGIGGVHTQAVGTSRKSKKSGAGE